MTEPILIAGAGIAGLALAQGLLKHGIPFRIFERDQHIKARTQGYRFRLTERGIRALEACLQPEHFRKLQRCCAEVTSESNMPQLTLDAVTAKPTKPLFDSRNLVTGTKPWVVDRTVMRNVLSQGLEQHLEYGKEVDNLTEECDSVILRFRDGTSARGCLLIGADGAWSRVRERQDSSYQLLDTEGRLLFGKTPLSDNFGREFVPEALAGLTTASAPNAFMLLEAMRFIADEPETPPDYVYWAIYTRKDQYMPDHQLLHMDNQQSLQLARRLSEQWHTTLQSLFSQPNTQASMTRVITSKPGVFPSTSDRIVLIGDAAHVMPPTAVLGATTSLHDAATLLDRLLEDHKPLPKGSEFGHRFREGMAVYATEALSASLPGARAVFGMKPVETLPVARVLA